MTVRGEVRHMSPSEVPGPFAEVVARFGDVVAKTVAYTLHSQARARWYLSATFDSRVDRDEIEELTHEVLMLLPGAIKRFRWRGQTRDLCEHHRPQSCHARSEKTVSGNTQTAPHARAFAR